MLIQEPSTWNSSKIVYCTKNWSKFWGEVFGIQDQKLQLLPSSMTGTILADFAIVATAKERPTDKDALMLYFLRLVLARRVDLFPDFIGWIISK